MSPTRAELHGLSDRLLLFRSTLLARGHAGRITDALADAAIWLERGIASKSPKTRWNHLRRALWQMKAAREFIISPEPSAHVYADHD